MEWNTAESGSPTPAMLRRVNVVGCSGSGKSTFARRLAQAVGHPYIELDQIYWEPNWHEPEVDVFQERVRAAIEGPEWVLDGNYHSKTKALKWARATLVVWIDLPFARTMWQVTTRSITRAWSGSELWPGTGNCESFGRILSRESMLLWTLHSHGRLRKRYAACMLDEDHAALPFVRLRSHADLEAFVSQCSAPRP